MHGRYVPTAAGVVRSPEWFAADYDPRRNTLAFVRTARETLAGQPFLDQRWNRDGLERCEFSLDALAAALPEDAPGPKLDFIWHTSFCCSTLIAEAFDLPRRHLSLREPLVLVPAADTKRAAMANRPMPPRLILAALQLNSQNTL